MGRRSYSPAISPRRVHSETRATYTLLAPAFPPNPAYIDLHYNPNFKGFDATPDGSRIAVATNTGVLTVDAATGAQQLLYSTAYADTPRITPDGRTVLMSIHPFTGHLWFPYLY